MVYITILIFALGIVFIVMNKKQPKIENKKSQIKSSYLMTNREKKMFNVMIEAMPECFVFTQVSMQAILWTKDMATRNKFNRKIIDYVVTNKEFEILAVVELDDKSHVGKEDKDAERDAMIKEAGYKAIRYQKIPNAETLRKDILS